RFLFRRRPFSGEKNCTLRTGPRGSIVTRHQLKMAKTLQFESTRPLSFSRSEKLAKKSGRPLTPKRPAFAFLVTPKLPAKRGEVLTY
ncbi:MAG: hypothetical protein Q7R45_01050, partial [Sulfuricaulis sp.]|nr:hypothetical protein [Sulfuricaulis sp.]